MSIFGRLVTFHILLEKQMTLESVYQGRLIKRIEELLPGAFVMKQDPNYRQGVPDLLICFGTAWAMLEVKADGKANKQVNQDYWIDKLDAMSFAAFVSPENEDKILGEMCGFLQVQSIV